MRKLWTTPQFHLIGSDPLQMKNLPTVREGTGHYVTLSSIQYRGFVNQPGIRAVALTINGVPVAHKTDLVS